MSKGADSEQDPDSRRAVAARSNATVLIQNPCRTGLQALELLVYSLLQRRDIEINGS